MAPPTPKELAGLNARFNDETPQAILRWAWETYVGDIAASSSFQTQSVPLLHIISRTVPELPILFLDTGFHFPETLRFRDELRERLGLNVVNVHPLVSKGELFRRYGDAPYRRDPDLCCHINKVEPMDHATKNLKALISGVRRDQTKNRSRLEPVMDDPRGHHKIHPMLGWTMDEVNAYMIVHELPRHPLHDQGYLSIGCAPCTRPATSGEDPRAGRWAGATKTECGLHLPTPDEPASPLSAKRDEEGKVTS